MGERILVTGGAGYIGSHACVDLLAHGYDVVVVDNLSNSSRVAIDRVRELAGRDFEFTVADLRDPHQLDPVFARHSFAGVIHFAGLKAVGESTREPLRYYDHNVVGTLVLLDAMRRHDVRRLIFSSSATVYGNPTRVPIREDATIQTLNPYGRTKVIIEDMLRDVANAERDWQIIALRYFNPIGAHVSGRLGEDPRGVPNNLMPYLMQVAVGQRRELLIFGDDYETRDGTGIRDYIHVVDLSLGHLAALEHLSKVARFQVYNLGTGRGASVKEVVAAAERAVGRKIPARIVERRPGDAAAVYADSSAAERELGWRALRDLDVMCADSWRWQSLNPRGYGGG
ncbi:MAG: UDP-glucose 4-epimerase GalE [Planctomycetota bacterium]